MSARDIRNYKFLQINWCLVVDALECQHIDLKLGPVCHRQPVQLLEDWSDMTLSRSTFHDASRTVLDALKSVQEVSRKPYQQCIAV